MTKDNQIKHDFRIVVRDMVVKHQKKIKAQGNIFNENLNWNDQITQEVLPGLKNRVSPKLRANYVTAIFKSKLNVGLNITNKQNTTAPKSSNQGHS